MRLLAAVLFIFLLSTTFGTAQSDDGLSGLWKFNPARSDVRSLPAPPDPVLKVEQSGIVLTISASSQEGVPAVTSTYPLDGSASKRQVGKSIMNTMTKWEGSSLLVNTLVSGPENYTVMERWTRSRDRNKLTIKRTIVRIAGESESILVYENAAAVPSLEREPESTAPLTSRRPQAQESPAEYVVEKGTRVLLRLTNSVDTKRTAAGDAVYLETVVPVFVNERLIIPRGSYVRGTVIDSHQAGRVKGKSALSLRFDSLMLPNGVARDFRSRPGSVDTRGNLDRSEGRIEGEGNKGGDARTVGQTTAAGAGIGSIAGAAGGHLGMGAGIGAAAGAAAGLAGVLGSRGPGVVLPPGTTMELVLDRELRFTAAELGGRVQ
jgi:type IV secretion system protein VirB10